MAVRYTLRTGERLKREADIEALFRTGRALSVFPLRMLWQLLPRGEAPFAIRAGFTAPKKKFKRAVDRNLIKRLMREGWRHQRANLEDFIPKGQQLHVFLLFSDRALPSMDIIAEAIGKGILHLQTALKTPGDA